MKKKLISLLLSVVMMVTLGLNIFADSMVQPFWEYMNDITLDVHFSGTKGTATLTVSRIYSVTSSIDGTVTVYEQVGPDDWEEVDSISDSSTRSLGIELVFTGEPGVNYKIVAEVTAHGTDGGSDSETVSKIRTCPSEK